MYFEPLSASAATLRFCADICALRASITLQLMDAGDQSFLLALVHVCSVRKSHLRPSFECGVCGRYARRSRRVKKWRLSRPIASGRGRWAGTTGRAKTRCVVNPLPLTKFASMPQQLDLKTAVFDSRFPNQVRVVHVCGRLYSHTSNRTKPATGTLRLPKCRSKRFFCIC